MSVYRIASQPNQISLKIEINRYDEVTTPHIKESFFICYEIASLSGEFQYWIWNALERWFSCPMKYIEESSDVPGMNKLLFPYLNTSSKTETITKESKSFNYPV